MCVLIALQVFSIVTATVGTVLSINAFRLTRKAEAHLRRDR